MRPMLCLSCIIALGIAVPTQAAPLSAGDTTSAAKRTTGAPANERRAYPASCLTYPLPAEPTGPVHSLDVTLYAVSAVPIEEIEESIDATAQIWRVPCTRSGDTYQAATLLRFVPHDPDAVDQKSWLTPVIRIGQNNPHGFTQVFGSYSIDGTNLARLTHAPNTILGNDSLQSNPFSDFSRTFVLENYVPNTVEFPNDPGWFEFDLPFTIMFDPMLNGDEEAIEELSMDVPGYEPTGEDYPTAFQSLPITGYMSSNWYAPEASGEGIVVQVYEREVSDPGECEDLGGGTILPFSFTWFTYGTDGEPFWIYGDACVPAADPARVTIDAFYTTGLGFAGAFDVENGERYPWGQVSLEFPACNEMTVDYESAADLPTSVPSGSGSMDYIRLGNVNSLVCD